MCTYQDCSTATELFATRAEWLAHKKGLHLRAWKCRSHPNIRFESQDKLEDHLRFQHTSMTGREIEASVKYSMTNLEDTRAYCCMCLVPRLQLPRGQSLANHMAHHFETFARPSLPDRGGEDDDIESEDSESIYGEGQEPGIPQDTDVDMPKVTADDFEDAANPGENMSIHALAVAGNKYGVRLLLEQESDVDARDDEGWTAMQRAAYTGQSTIVQMLLGAGADVKCSSGYYGNALQCAALQGHEELVRSLIDGGANVNQQGGYHGTALLAAACQGHETTVEILLESGAIVDLPNGRHTSATTGARHYGHFKLAQRLELKASDQRASHGPWGMGGTTTPYHHLNRQNTQPPWQHSPALGGEFVYRPRADKIVLKTSRTFARPHHISIESLQHAKYEGPLVSPHHGDRPLNMIPQGDVEVVFQQATKSQIARREPARQPEDDRMAISLSDAKAVSTLFPAFKVRTDANRFFRVGTVFTVLWSRPEEEGSESISTKWEPGIVLNHMGERVFTKVRRFVVIREGVDYCYALPIDTYGGHGVSEARTVKPDHVIVHSSRHAPLPRPEELPRRGEAPMRHVPIRVELDNPGDVLDPMSRLNLAGVTMVQHNIKVQSFGKVCEVSMNDLRRQFEIVWGPDLPTPQIAARPAKNEESDDDDDDEEQGSDEDDDDDDADEDDDDNDGSGGEVEAEFERDV